MTTAIAAFDAAKVTITRKRFSTTQGETLIEYNGQRIEQYGDDPKLCKDGQYRQRDDAFWIGIARREAIARGLATEPTPPAPKGAKFEAGKTYYTRSIVDSETIIKLTVARRTAKTIVTSEGKRLRISHYNGAEQVAPHGRYSMCAIIGADRPLEEAPAAPAEEAPIEAQATEAAAAETPEQLGGNVISLTAWRARRAA